MALGSMEILWIQDIFPFICLKFLSPMSHSFQCTDLPFPWLNLFLPKYFIVLHAIVNENVLFIFSDSSLLVRTNTTDFCMLILYLEILSNHLLVITNFCWHL